MQVKIHFHTMLLIIPLLLALLSPFTIIAQSTDTSLAKGTWYDYEGTLGSASIQMSLYVFNDNTVKGNYLYKKYCIKIPLEGKIVNGQVQLTELNNGKPNGYFTSTLWCTYKANLCEGTWTDAGKTKSIAFKLGSTGDVQGSFEDRYPDFATDTLENFMKKVKGAILESNKDWLANNISFPINASVDGKRKAIKSKQAFINDFDKIVTSSFKERIKGDVPCNLFGNYQGYMLGNGDIWVNSINGKAIISAINN